MSARATDVDVRASGQEVGVIFQHATGAPSSVRADRLLVATGRTPVLDGITAERLGLRMEGPFVKANARLETSVPGVYAIGDAIGGVMLAHKASAEGEAAVSNILGRKKEVDPRRVPRCIWGLTEIGAVGLTGEEAEATGRRIKIGRFSYVHSGAAQAMGKPDGFVKLIGDSVLAMNVESAVEDMADSIRAHPTLGENVMDAARDWNGMTIHSPKKRSTCS